MYIEEFTALVKRMRTTQKEYFSRRSQTALIDSKNLERQVDQALAAGISVLVEKPAEKQLSIEDVMDGAA